MTEINWHEAVAKADLYKLIGQNEIHLYHDLGEGEWDRPWEYVTEVRPGGSHRLDIDTSVWFTATHPSGLSIRWTFDIEPHTANGSGTYHIDAAGCRKVLSLLPIDQRQAFQDYLTACSNSVLKHAQEGWKYVQREFHDAEILRRLGDASPENKS